MLMIGVPAAVALAFSFARPNPASACSCIAGEFWLLELTEVTEDGAPAATASYAGEELALHPRDDSHAQLTTTRTDGGASEGTIQLVRR
jgi:hypothetical protein